MPDRKKGRSLFWTILMPQFFVLLLVVLVLTLSFPISGMGDRVTRNYQNVIALQTANQGDYVESYISEFGTNLASLSKEVTRSVQEMVDAGGFSVEQLDSDPACYNKILLAVYEDVFSIATANHVSGAFVILNTEDLDLVTQRVEKPALFIRDTNPMVTRQLDDDLRLMRAPDKVAYELMLVKDESWQPTFGFEDQEQQAFFYKTFQRAYTGQNTIGYWTENTYQLEGSEPFAMSYSVPLILRDGTVIGIAGVELLVDHLSYFLPSGQLLESDESVYLIACSFGDDPTNIYMIFNGGEELFPCETGAKLELTPLAIGGYGLMCGDREFFAQLHEITPFGKAGSSGFHWYLVGVVGMNDMFSFSNEMTNIVLVTLLLALLVGVVSVITVSRRLAKPISVLAAEVETARSAEQSEAVFTDTGIEEIDRLSASFRELMQEKLDASTKFLRIMDMASVELAGYEWREGSDSFFVTENFFPMLGMKQPDMNTMTVDAFRTALEDIRSRLGASITLDGDRIYCINRGGTVRYVRAESSQEGERNVGLLEDVTRSTMERIRIEHERDYDVLTGLYNRRAFYNRASQLFTAHDQLHNTALMVLDADNLKMVNDRFGHDYGDKYLCQIARCIMGNTPSNALCARISGDEIYVLLHGYRDSEKLRIDIQTLMNAIRSATLQLPNGETMELSVSGGIASYPDDSRNLSELVKYADFAMYQAKGNQKGFVLGFDSEEYAKNETFIRGRGELRKLIEQENVIYHFQPIYSARTARPAAYEALMRVDMPSIKSPDVVLRLAAAEGSQYQIERITMFKATETYRRLLENGQVVDDAMLFINSQPDQCLTAKDAQKFHEEFSALQSRIVLEITEDEYLGLDALEVKRKYPGFSGNFALDDYGSGYNGEKNLLLLQPRFVKVDVVFIRGIDSNPDRQQLVSSLVSYAHGRDMQVVAEGIETAEELQKVLELGVDLFQGYFLARPAAVPGAIAPQAEEIIKRFNRE